MLMEVSRTPRADGGALAPHFLTTISFCDGAHRYRLIPTRANTQPAFGCYLLDSYTPIWHAHGLIVLTLTGNQISAVTRFSDTSVLAHFGLPRTLRD
jgi:hypothetical protein